MEEILQHLGVSKNTPYPKMDGENNGKPYEQMEELGGFPPYVWVDTHLWCEKKPKDLRSSNEICRPWFLNDFITSSSRKQKTNPLRKPINHEIQLLMAEILHQLIGSFSHYL